MFEVYNKDKEKHLRLPKNHFKTELFFCSTEAIKVFIYIGVNILALLPIIIVEINKQFDKSWKGIRKMRHLWTIWRIFCKILKNTVRQIKMLSNYWHLLRIVIFSSSRVKLLWKDIRFGARLYTPVYIYGKNLKILSPPPSYQKVRILNGGFFDFRRWTLDFSHFLGHFLIWTIPFDE